MRHPIATAVAVAVVFAAPAASCWATEPAKQPPYSARVVGVADGDTLTVLTAGRQQARIRLYGVDAPESAQPFGQRAKQATSALAFGQDVTITPRDVDRYGRTVAQVRLPDGRDLGRALVGSGWAWWYRQYAPDDQELGRLEAEARAAHRGLWAQGSAVPPWEWRARGRGRGGPASGGGTSAGSATSASSAGPVVGNRRSGVYHRPECASVGRMSAGNRVEIRSVAEAERSGFRRAGDCWR